MSHWDRKGYGLWFLVAWLRPWICWRFLRRPPPGGHGSMKIWGACGMVLICFDGSVPRGSRGRAEQLTKYLAEACTPQDLRVLALLCYKRRFVYTDHWWGFIFLMIGTWTFYSDWLQEVPVWFARPFKVVWHLPAIFSAFPPCQPLFPSSCASLLAFSAILARSLLPVFFFWEPFSYLSQPLLSTARMPWQFMRFSPFLLKCFVSHDQDMFNPNFLWQTIAGTLSGYPHVLGVQLVHLKLAPHGSSQMENACRLT